MTLDDDMSELHEAWRDLCRAIAEALPLRQIMGWLARWFR